MSGIKFLVFSIVLACLHDIEAAPEATCKEFVSTLTKKQLGGISSCSKSMKFKNPKEKAAKMNCILKCVLTNEKMLEDDGSMVGDDKFNEFIESVVPSNLGFAIEKLRACKAIGVNLADNDDNCKAYDPLIKCMLDVIGSMCKGIA